MEKSGVIDAIQKGPIKVLDNACGTGIVADTIYARLEKSDAAQDNLTLVATDLGPAMVEAMQAKIDKNGWKKASAQVVDMQVGDHWLLLARRTRKRLGHAVFGC